MSAQRPATDDKISARILVYATKDPNCNKIWAISTIFLPGSPIAFCDNSSKERLPAICEHTLSLTTIAPSQMEKIYTAQPDKGRSRLSQIANIFTYNSILPELWAVRQERESKSAPSAIPQFKKQNGIPSTLTPRTVSDNLRQAFQILLQWILVGMPNISLTWRHKVENSSPWSIWNRLACPALCLWRSWRKNWQPRSHRIVDSARISPERLHSASHTRACDGHSTFFHAYSTNRNWGLTLFASERNHSPCSDPPWNICVGDFSLSKRTTVYAQGASSIIFSKLKLQSSQSC